MEILLFVLKYMYISLLLKMINGFSWPAKIMVSPFKKTRTPCCNCAQILQVTIDFWKVKYVPATTFVQSLVESEYTIDVLEMYLNCT